jgi:hypothetical protein
MQRSGDDGITWDAPSIIFPRHVGVNGEMSLVVDSNNELHLFFGQRITGSPDIHGMWHSMLTNNRWTEPEAIVKGPRVRDLVDRKGFDPNYARAVVSQGNVILVTWMTDPAAGFNGVWYSYKRINAPELPLVKFPSLVEANDNLNVVGDPSVGSLPIATAPKILTLENDKAILVPTDKSNFQNNPSLPIIIGSISAIIVILFAAIAYGLDRRK